MSDSKSSSGGVGFAGLLTIAFIVLKLCKVIDWSWWWVISPIFFSIGIMLLIIGVMGLFYFRESLSIKRRLQKRNKQREAGIKELQDKANEVQESINKIASKSKWQQRMDEMQQKQKTGAN
jgi:uncharacterized membrane protein YciS (DUF1049 family)